MLNTFLAACELKRKLRTALFAAVLLSFAPAIASAAFAQEHPPAATAAAEHAQPEGEHAAEASRSKHRRNDPRHGVAGRQLHHLPRRSLLLLEQAVQGIPRRPQLDDPKRSRRSRGAARAAPTRSSPRSNRSCRRCPASSTRCAARGAEEISAEEQRIAAAAAADRERLLEQTRREIELQVRLAKKEILEHAADLSVQLATERIKKEVTPADQIAPGRSLSAIK